ncbi:class I SAM-dependent methyltransferase [Tamlana fucoidanivorans]|uniref:Class I SAM-dependent methyltransferase n=1 Tax=Allotamlana fucoidanivorans TaxID=2583814 RepID=A0A5C4SSZ4_9FLAO|nr:class I SAM-dependent methyltransferase [Tamlana fucoidanivorans]TNJ46633.1 class I SAM-dependent methyltransferase [Tamlana fucoidanivorans]
MNSDLLTSDIQDFISKHLDASMSKLVLKGTPFNINTKVIVEQIEAKNRCRTKLPTWFNTPNIYYPNKLNIEQTSSEITAEYKSNLISGRTIIDLTGGFGVDCFYFSKKFEEVTHCDINESLSKIVAYNYQQLLVNNIGTVNIDGIEYLKSNKKKFDWIYIDPSRRHDRKGKVFFLNDCLPNVPKHLNMLFEYTQNIMVKTSPLLDIMAGTNELKQVKTIHVVAVNNEVKELLWILEKDYKGDITLETINISKVKTEQFTTTFKTEQAAIVDYNKPLNYLYEPNAAILKAGAFKSIAEKLPVSKLEKHSHLYTSNSLVDFPGRQFKIEKIVPYNKKALKKLNISRANVTTRNFPENVQHIRKKLNIKDGGDNYLFFTTLIDGEKTVLLTKKVNT